jgi:hypothetical protein
MVLQTDMSMLVNLPGRKILLEVISIPLQKRSGDISNMSLRNTI